MTEAHGADALTTQTKELTQLLTKASKGDQQVMPAFRAALDRHPWLWQECGNLAKTTRDTLIRRIAGEQDLGQQEMYIRKLEAMTQELRGSASSPLERLLVERIVLGWLHLHYAEGLYVQTIKEATFRQAEFYQSRISKIQARYLSAIRTLAQVRRLGVPTVQVNIAEQQVNVTG